jgi:RHS repeat-associated protein
MRFAVRLSVIYMASCALLGGWSAAADAGISSSSLGAGGSLMGGALVTPGSPLEREQLEAQEEARLTSPEAVAEREASRTKYEHLGAEQAAMVAGEVFPAVVDEPAGGPPKLGAGETITGYSADNTALVDMGNGGHGAIESSLPMAMETAPGKRVPIDLGLTEAAGAFQPTTAPVSVRLPKRLGEGVQLAEAGLSLIPVNGGGEPLAGSEGAVDGAGVLYANTGTDQDTLVKPTTSGFEADTLLRSVESPEQISFLVRVPEGASLVQAKDGSGAVAVVKEGTTIALVSPPSARDAVGRSVPVSVSVSGAVLTLTVAHRSGEYTYPLEVDPTVTDSAYLIGSYDGYGENWLFYNGSGPQFSGGWGTTSGTITNNLSITRGEWAYIYYLTKGASQIYTWHAKTESTEKGAQDTDADMFIWSEKSNSEGHAEGSPVVLPRTGTAEETVCALSGCAVPGSIESGRGANGAFFEAYVETSYENDHVSYSASESSVGIVQYAGPWAGFDTTDQYLEGYDYQNLNEYEKWIVALNPLYGGGRWVRRTNAMLGFEGTDPGVGVDRLGWKSSSEPNWGTGSESYGLVGKCKGAVQCNECVGSQCTPAEPVTHNVWFLPEGEDPIEVIAKDGVGMSASAKATVKIDNAPPHSITLAGLPPGNEVGDGQSHELKLKATATDGVEPVHSSGMASFELAIDGKSLGSSSGSCSPGPCTATSGEWTLNTEEYAAGKHTLTVIATDNVGNAASENFTLTIHHASPVSIGPGSVNPLTGEFHVDATDVSVSGPGAAMTVSRSYASRHLAAGAEGPLGPLWTMSVSGEQSIMKLANGSVVLTNSAGQQSTFTSSGGKFVSPPGDAPLMLKETTVQGALAFQLTSGNTVTTFEHPSGGSESVWMPAITEGTGGTNTSTFAFQTVEVEGKKITEPIEELAPVPYGVSCSPTLSKGCRALTFNYATSTTATGENASEWGDYNGRLTRVYFTAWDPSKKEMTTSTVAQYAYDKQGRLRAEWNPLISPALKTDYGYDAQGHLTALTPPGQESWAMIYGTSSGDLNMGRLLKVMRPSASTPLWAGEASGNTETPKLSGSAVVGVRMAVSNGSWTNSPITFGYQWEDCNSEGKECTPIAGATNANYTPVSSDVGCTLIAQVTATNGGGSVLASSLPSAVVTSTGTKTEAEQHTPAPGWTIEYHTPISGTAAPYAMGVSEVEAWGQKDDPTEATAIFPPDERQGWPASSYKRASIEYLDSHDRVVNAAAPGGGISTVEYNETNDVVRTLSPSNRQTALAEGSKSAETSKLLDSENTYNSEGTELLSTTGPQHNVQLSGGTQAQAREITHYYYDEGAPSEGGPYDLVTKTTTAALVSGKEEETRTTLTSYSGQENLGWKLRKPTSTTTDPAGLKLVHTVFYDPQTGDVIETRMPAAGSGGSPAGKYAFLSQISTITETCTPVAMKSPDGVAFDSSGDQWVADTGNDRVDELSSTGKYITRFGSEGTGNGQFKEPRGIAVYGGDVWVADTGNNRVQEFTTKGEFVRSFGGEGTENGKFKKPVGVAIETVGKEVWVADSGNSRIQRFSWEGKYVSKTALEGKPEGIAIAKERVWVSAGSDVWEYSWNGEKLYGSFGGAGSGNGQLKEPAGLAVSGKDVYVADRGNSRIEEFQFTEKESKTTGEYVSQWGTAGSGNGQFKEPQGVALDKEGHVWAADAGNNRTQEFNLIPAGPHATQTIYYTGGPNSYTTCGEHPEWAGMPCVTQPAEQPTGSLGNLPVATYMYNIWDVPETTSEVAGSATRSTTATFDAAGRLKSSTISSTVGTALPTVTAEYNETTGALEKESTTAEGKTKTITSTYNTLGELATYTDADEATTSYEYDMDGRIKNVNDGKGTETYTYNETSGLPTELVNEYAATKLAFTATYGTEGNLLTEGYPNGMTAKYTSDATGDTIGLEYVKTTHCSEKCVWYSDSVMPSIYGQWLSQTSTLSSQNYKYDNAGRLIETQDTPVGKGCTTRLYGYEEDTNRTSMTTRELGSEGKCATEGGTTEKHTYDEADRLNDSGIAYDAFGNILQLPAADAGGSELTSSFYVNDELASQTQNGETIGYYPDPTGRTREAVSTGKTSADIISHYAGGGDSPAWTVEEPSGHWTRNIAGIDGSLCATQFNGEAPVLQLSNLHGDIIATAALSEVETKLLSTNDTTEYGVPRTSIPPRYSWLGSVERPTELPSGVIAMGVRSYVPQLGRFLQDDPVPGGSANAYAYTYGDPVNTSDPSGESTGTPPAWAIQAGAQVAEEAVARRAAEEAAARAEAERKIAEEEAAAAAYWAYWNSYSWVPHEAIVEGSVNVALTGGSGASAAGINFGAAYCTIKIEGSGVWDDGFETWSFSNQWKCHGNKRITINAAWNYVGITPSDVYSSSAPAYQGVFFTDLITVGLPGPESTGLCIAATYRGQANHDCYAAGTAP